MNLVRRLQRDIRGVTAVEFSLLLPLFLLVLLAVLNFGIFYFYYSRIERGVFLAQKSLSEGVQFKSAEEVKTLVCEEAGIGCDGKTLLLEVMPLTSTPPADQISQKDKFEIKPGQTHVLRTVYPWSGLLPLGPMKYIGLEKLVNTNIQVGVFFYVKN